MDRRDLTPNEEAAFERLFNEVVYFSPFPEERAAIPNYRSDEEIRQAAEAADAALSQSLPRLLSNQIRSLALAPHNLEQIARSHLTYCRAS